MPTDLVPNRDVGLQLHGDMGDGVFSYALGVFNGVVDGGSVEADTNDKKSFAGRIFVHPFKLTGVEPLQGFGLGVGGSDGNEHGTSSSPGLPSFKTSPQQTFFVYRSAVAATITTPAAPAVVSDGQLVRVSSQAYYYWGPFGLMGEYVISSQEVTLNAPTGVQSAKLKNSAAQVAVSYLLTGGAASYNGVTPKRPFDSKSGAWGEFELKARYSKLTVDKDAFPIYANPLSAAKEAKEWVAGINWYLNKNVKVVFEYENTSFE